MSNSSVPRHVSAPPRPLRDEELATLLAAADVLIPEALGRPAATEAPGYERWLDRALAARSDVFDRVLALIDRLSELDDGALEAALRRLSDEEPTEFHALSSVIAGAYLLVPAVRRAINYPGQERRPARFDEAAEEIMSGILDPVLERGPIYMDPDDAGRGGELG